MFGNRTKPFLSSGANLSADLKGQDSPLLKVEGLSKTFVSRGLFGTSHPVVAVEDVWFTVDRGEAVALVGESGSGKSTIARILLRLERPDAGRILLDGVDFLAREPRRASLSYRRRVQMVFQDPFGSLNRTHDIQHHLARPLLRHGRATSKDVREKAIDLLHAVGLEPAEEFISRRPYELSGGQRQRVAIARALAVDPDLLIADEPTSMLDVSIRMDILTLLIKLKTERRLAMLLITHDLASARYLADRVLVLFRGRIVEGGPADELVVSPAHPYTRALLASIADVGELGTESQKVEADPEEERARGCPFAPRCPDAMDICRKTDPSYRNVGSRRVRCHLYPESAEPEAARPEAVLPKAD
ncbi:MAG: ABC transporter ATP-binding protein, partial [Candidatus Eisenbacteria bacterium]|nr:ABC transporter ATP-binding protein [Candidatus Eisenbacteria bacterium]